MTRDRILEASAHEIERNGLTMYRVKRVAAEAGISVALMYSYFSDREELIATTIVHRFRQVLLSQADTFTEPLRDISSIEQLRVAVERMIVDAQDPARDEQRLLRIEGMSFAHHNLTASHGIAEAKQEASSRIVAIVEPLEQQGLLAPGVTAVAFARIWYALFFGQIALDGEHPLSIDKEHWVAALQVLGNSLVASHTA
jgi:AcrR family transcriptional regulator